MKAWPVIQRYDQTLMPMGGGYSPLRPAQAKYLEFRLADEWGDPSELVASAIRLARLADGSELQPCEVKTFLSKQGKLKISAKHRAHAPCWQVQELD